MARPDRTRRAVLLLTPVLLPVSMGLTFRAARQRLGDRGGYLAGFLVYWLGWCLALPLWVVGFRNLPRLYGRPRQERRDRIALAVPPALGLVAALPHAARDASPVIVAGSAAIAAVNGALEEFLWRGAYQHVFPGETVAGLIVPTAGFAAWHYAPQTIVPNPRPGGATSLVIAAGAVGLLWGHVARRTGSISGTTASHIVFDFSGLGARIYASPRS